MGTENMYQIIGWVGSISSLIGLVAALIQTIRFRHSQKLLASIKRNHNANIWTNIGLILQAYESVGDARDGMLSTKNVDPVIHSKINSVRRTVVNLYVHLLREAVLDEDEFTEDTIDLWKTTGRLENDWRVAQAKRLVQTKHITKVV